MDKIGPGKSTITASNPRGLSITQNKIPVYEFIHDNFEIEENNDVDYGNENMKTLKMGSFRETLKRLRENNINSINDDFNNERTPTFSTPVRQNDEAPNINVNIENPSPIEIGITPQVMLTSNSSTDLRAHYNLQDSAKVIQKLNSPLVNFGFRNVSQRTYDYKRQKFLHPSLMRIILRTNYLKEQSLLVRVWYCT